MGNGHSINNGPQPGINSLSHNHSSSHASNSGGNTFNNYQESQSNQSQASNMNQKPFFQLYIDDPNGETKKTVERDLLLKHDDFKTPLLQSVYEGDQSTLDADLEMTKRTQFTYKYEHDLMLVFWLAVHLENLEIAQALVRKEKLIKKLVACIPLKNNPNSKKSSIDMVDSRLDSNSPMAMTHADAQRQFFKQGSSNTYSTQSKQQQNKRKPPLYNNEYGDEQEFESESFSSNELSQSQLKPPSHIQIESGSSNKSSFVQSSSSSEISRSLQIQIDEQRRLKQRQQQLRQQNQLFEGGDKEGSKKQKKSKKRSKKNKEDSIGAEEMKSSSSNGNQILPIKSISNYKEMPNIVVINPQKKGNDTTKNSIGQNSEGLQSYLRLTPGIRQSQAEGNLNSNWSSSNYDFKSKFGQYHFQQSSNINDISLSQSSRQVIQPAKVIQPQKTLGQVLRELKLAQQEESIIRVSNKNSNLDAYLEQFGVTPEQVERVQFISMEDLLRLKQHFKTDSMTVMSHILKLAIQMGENKLTWIITLEYEIIIEEEMFANAIFTENYQWLFFVWAAKKNYIGNRQDQKNSNFITFEQLFEMILKISKDGKFGERNRVERNIKRVLDWRIQSDDNINNNIIRCLLAHHQDILAVDYMGVYNKLLNKQLLIYCIDHGNIYFLRNALLLAAFDKMLFREDLVILELLTILKKGYSTNFILNILSLIDISVWKNKRLKSLIEIINDYVDEKYSRNRLLLSANPLMSISIACELLNKIADARRKFESECFQIQQELLKLGQMYTKKIEDETYYESILMAKDFSDRNLIKIITQNSFEKLMEEKDPKAERVMMMIWRGKEAAHCDGDIFGYSNLVHVIMSKPKKIMERNHSQFIQIVTNFFQMNTKMNYSFQYRFRIESIQFYFYKEFLCAFLMLIIFQYVNYRYLLLFSNKAIKGIDQIMLGNQTYTIEINNSTEQYEANLLRVKESVKDYTEWNFWVIFFSAALIFQHLLKVLFNIYSNLKIGLDKWTVMDVLSASLNIIAMVLINQVNPSAFLQPRVKDLIDYFMLLVLTVSWLRFFSYYLVVRSISKLLLTLIEMIGDTLSFLFIVSCFILIMSSIFATLYQDNYPEKYGGLAKTVTTLFNGVVAQYSYDDEEMKGRVISHSILTITHVFFTNIILMNYLIAILSSTYGKMKESGIFSFKVNLYQYCERYLIAFKDRDYGEMVMHPPPLAFIVGIIIPFSCSRIFMAKLSKWMSYLMYWLENIVYIAIFMIFEVFISPIAYFKIWYNLFLIVRTTGIGTTGLVKGGMYCLIWAFLGPFIMIWINIMDLKNFMIILMQHDGFTRTKQEKIAANRADDTTKLQLYNETRAVVISLYQKLIRLIAKESLVQQTPYPNLDELTQEESSDEDDFERIPDFFIIEDQQQMNMSNINDEQHYFLLKKTLIIEEWKKRRILIERRLRLKQNDFSSSGDASNNRLDMLTKTLRRGMKNKHDYFTKERQRRQSTPFIHWEKTTLNIQKQKQQSKNGRGDLTTHMKGAFLEKIAMTMQKKFNEEDKVDMSDFKVPEDEEAVVDQFLSKFTIKDNLSLAFNLLENMPESGQKDIIDIKLMINALPNRIMNYGLENVEMFNFRIFQESLHAYQNLDIVKVFEFFDKKNKERIQIVRNRLLYQKELIADSNDLLEKVIEKFEASPSLGTIPNSQEAAELKKKWLISKQLTNAANNALKKQPENAFNRMNSINYGAVGQRSPSILGGGGAAGSSSNNISPGDDSTSNNVSNNRRSSNNNSADAGISSSRHADKRASNMFQPTAN